VAISLLGLDEASGLRDAATQLDAAVHASGLRGQFSSTLRTRAEQTRLYKRFLAGQSQFPASPPGGSAHEYGLAFDYVVSPYTYQPDVGQWAQANLGLAWSPNDAVHFEVPGASDWAMGQLGAFNLNSDPIRRGIEAVSDLPWYVSLLAPWQIEVLKTFPLLQTLIDPAWPLEKIKSFIASY
jgi:hypothetical protein